MVIVGERSYDLEDELPSSLAVAMDISASLLSSMGQEDRK